MRLSKVKPLIASIFLLFGLQSTNAAPLKILVVNQSGAFVNSAVVNWLSNYLSTVVGPEKGWTVVIPGSATSSAGTDTLRAKFRDDTLSTYNVIIFNNNTSIGNVITDVGQRQAFQRWLRRGGGMVGFGALLDHADLWPFITDSVFAGTKMTDHSTWNSTGGANAQVRWDTIPTGGEIKANRIEYSLLKAGYPSGQFTYPGRWYSFRSNPRLATPSAIWGNYPRAPDILMNIDENTYDVPPAVKMGPDHPLAWAYKLPPLCDTCRQGRFIYDSRGYDLGAYDGVSAGHAPNGIDTGSNGIHNWFVQSIIWAAGNSPSTALEFFSPKAHPGISSAFIKNGSLQVGIAGSGKVVVEVFDLSGHQLSRQTGEANREYFFSNLRHAALYLIRAQVGKQTYTKRVLF